MARTPRKNKSGAFKEVTPVLDGLANIYRCDKSGMNWQFRMFIRTDNQDYKCSLRTKDFESAIGKARTLAIKLSGMIEKDIKVFGMTLQELVEEYLEYRHNDVINGDIVKGRWGTIKSQLKNMTNLKSGDIKLSELDRDCMFDYQQERKLQSPGVVDVTIRNEQATINSMISYAYRKGNIHFEKLNFKKIRIRKDDIGVRSTFTLDEYDELIKFMRSYVAKKNCPDDVQRNERLMMRDYVLIASNTYLRVGEQRQLTFGDILKYETHYDEPTGNVSFDEDDYQSSREIHLVHINVRAETSKVRNQRTVITRGGNYFKRLSKRTEYTEPHHLIFSNDGHTPLTSRKWILHWENLMKGIGIDNHRERKLTWYSLRHFGISMRVMANVSLIDLSKLAGTSVHHIENTYLKYSEEQARSSALKNFNINKDGTIQLND
jgi:hypothetical protein